MSAVLDVRIEVNKDGAIEINKVKREANEAEKATNKLESSTRNLDSSMASLAKKVGLAVGSMYALKQAFDFGASFVATSAQFESFETTLTSITGSSEKAKASMAWIQDFTASTPFELAQVTEGFVKMKAYGLEPMDGTLRTLGDTASAMGKDIVQAVEAMADAVTGENERLKEFGIKASKEGDTITYAWSDSSGKARNIVIENNKDIIQSTLNAIFNEKYIGAMDAQSKTWDGMMSNLSDRWTLFKKDFMDAGLFTYLKAILGVIGDRLGEAFGDAKAGAKTFSDNVIGGIKSIILAFGNMSDMWNGVKFAFKSVESVFYALVAGIGDGINTIADGWDSMTVALKNGFKGFVDGVGTAFYSMINYLLSGINSLVNGASDGLGGLFEYIGVSNPFGKINLSVGQYVSSIETATKSTEKLVNTDWSNNNLKESLAEADKLLENIINEDGKNGAIKIISDIDKKVAELNTKEAKGNDEKEKAKKLLDEMGAGYGSVADSAKKSSKAQAKALKDKERELARIQKLEDRALVEREQAIQDYNERFANDFYSSFDSMLHGDLMGSFDSFFGGVSSQLMQPFLDDMSKSFSTSLNSILGGLGSFGSFLGGGLLSLGGMLLGSLFGDSEEPAPILGDNGKTSETLRNALDDMLDVQYPMLELTREMTGYLQTISKAFGGVENSLLRSGIDIGGNLFQDTYKKGTLFGGKSTSLYGTSIEFTATSMVALMEGQVEAVLDTVTKTVKTKWYGAKKTSYSHKYTDISDMVSQYIQDGTIAIFESLTASAEALGLSTTVEEEVTTWVADTTDGIYKGFYGGFTSGFNTWFNKAGGGFRGLFSLFGRRFSEETGQYVTETVISSLENEIIDIGKFDTTGMSADEVAQEIQDRFSAQLDAITEKYFGAVKEFQKAGEGLGETLFRVVRNFDQIGHSLGLIDKAVDWRTANIIADVAGGLDKFNASFNSYTENFYSDAEQYEMKLKTMTSYFASIGQTMPSNNAGFRALVESIDTTTDAGATLFAELMSINDAFTDMTSSGEALRETTRGYLDEISSFLMSKYSFLTAQGKTDYANMMLEQSIGGNGLISQADASRLRLEQAYSTATTKEDFNLISMEHLQVLVDNAEKDATNTDIVNELRVIQDKLSELEETTRIKI